MEQQHTYNQIQSNYKMNDIRYAMLNNTPIEEKLHVIAVMFNPTMLRLTEHPSKYSKEYELRYKLFKEFVERMERDEPNVILYIVEMAYGDSEFVVTDSDSMRHLQLRTEVPLWHRENLVNLGVKRLLPLDWKAMAWIDADLEFENPSWAEDTLKILNGTRDIVQLYSHCQFIEKESYNIKWSCKHVFTSFGFNHEKGHKYSKTHPQSFLQYWSHGFAFACTRQMYDAIGGLSDFPHFGYSMFFLLSCFNDLAFEHLQSVYPTFGNRLIDLRDQVKTQNLKLGYVPGTILHHFHGIQDNRDPSTMEHQVLGWENIYDTLTYNDQGILIPDFRREQYVNDFINHFNSHIKARNAQKLVIVDNNVNASNIHLYIRTCMTNDSSPMWGTTAWIFLHAVTRRWNSPQLSDLILVVELILRNTPCEHCSKDSAKYLADHPFDITTQNDLVLYLFEFHNYLNKQFNKPLFLFEDLSEKYENISFDVIYPVFIEQYINKNRLDQQEPLSKVTKFFEANKEYLL